MRRIVGNEVIVFLKDSENGTYGDMGGLLVDVSEENLYVRDSGSSQIYVIPRDNVRYCTTNNIPPSRPFVEQEVERPRLQPQPQPQQPQRPSVQPDSLSVFVNGEFFVKIPTPPSVRLDSWGERVASVLYGNPDVQQILAGKVQKKLDYCPGEVYIEVEQVTPPSQMPHSNPGYVGQNSFSMSGSPVTQYMTSSQMVSRLNKVVRKQKDETEVMIMVKKQMCNRCGKPINGKIRIVTYRKKLGSKSINKVEMYDEKCFKIKNKEKAINGCCKQKRTCKKRCKK